MGRADGVSKDKGGSMHIFAHNFYDGNGIVGAQVPLGAGIAFSEILPLPWLFMVVVQQIKARSFEIFNMGTRWDLPIISVCENNRYGMGTSAG